MAVRGQEASSRAVLGHHALAAGAGAAVIGGLLFSSPAYDSSVLPFTVAALTALGALVVLERRRPVLRRRLILGLVLALLVAAVLIPPRRSGDVWLYAMYGRMVAVHDASPYTQVPSDYSLDPAYPRTDKAWRNTRALYGPGFITLTGGIARLVGTAELPTRLAYQGLAALAVGLGAVLIDRRTRDPMAVFLVVANPAVIAWTVNGAHNDALVGLALLGSVLLVERRRLGWAGAALGAAVLVKAVALVAVVPLAWWLWNRPRHFWAAEPGAGTIGLSRAADPTRRPDPAPVPALISGGREAALVAVTERTPTPAPVSRMTRRDRLRGPAVLGATAGLVVLAGYALTGGRPAVGALSRAADTTGSWSFWRPIAEWTGTGPTPRILTGAPNRLAALLVIGLVALLAAARATDRTPALATAGAVLVYLLGAPYTVVWYLAWLLPLLGLAWRSRMTLLGLAFSALYLVAVERPGTDRAGVNLAYERYLVGLRLFEVAALLALAAAAVATLVARRRSANREDILT